MAHHAIRVMAVLVLIAALTAAIVIAGCGKKTETSTENALEPGEPQNYTSAPADTAPEPATVPETPEVVQKDSDEMVESAVETQCVGNIQVHGAAVAADTATTRKIAVTYVPSGPKGSEAYNRDAFSLFKYIAVAQETAKDLGRAILCPVEQDGNAISTITALIPDLMAWHSGQMTDAQFQAKWDTW